MRKEAGLVLSRLGRLVVVALLAAAVLSVVVASSGTGSASPGNARFALARYKPNGSLDTGFSGDGKVVTNFSSSSYEWANGVAIDSSGRIVTAGSAYLSGGGRFAVARYKPNGSLDTGFSGDGKVVTNFPASTGEGAEAVAIDSSGRIVAAGYANLSGGARFALARYKPNGSLDTSFSGDGKVVTNFPASTGEYAYGVAIDSSGRIVVAGYANLSGGNRFALARYKPNGSLDTAFSGDGKVVTNFSSSTHEGAYDVAVDSSGRIVVAGRASLSGGNRFALARYRPNGSLDTAFSGDGKVVTNFLASTNEVAYGVAIDSSGRIVVAGDAYLSGGWRFALARYKPNGSLDTAFSGDGKVVTNFPASSHEGAYGVAIDSSGRIVAAGWAYLSGGLRFALACYKPNGSLDTAFKGDGKVVTNFPASSSEGANGVAIDSSGRIVVAGYAGYLPT